MAPKQATLGRFFTLPAGTKPPVQQQTKLKTTKKDAVKEEEEDETHIISAEGDKGLNAPVVRDEEGDSVMAGTTEAEVVPEKKRRGTVPKEKGGTVSKKRSRKLEKPAEGEPESVSEKEDQEPVTKRGRHSSAPKSPEKGKKPPKKAEGPKEKEPEAKSGTEGEDGEPVTKRGKHSLTPKSPAKGKKPTKKVVGSKEKEPEAKSGTEDEDGEPVTKRGKNSLTPKSPAKGKKPIKKVVGSKEKESEAKSGTEDEDEEPVTKRGKLNPKSPAKPTKKVVGSKEKESEAKSGTEDEDDEPVTKRGKHSLTPKSPVKAKKLTKKPEESKEEESEARSGTEGEDEEPVTKRGKRPLTPKSPAKEKKTAKKLEESKEELEVKSEVEDEDDEPVTKGGKRSTITKTPKKATSASKGLKKSVQKPRKPAKEVVEEPEHTPEEDEEPVVKRGRKSATSKKPESPKRKAKSIKVEELDEGSKSAVEEEAEVGSDGDMKPALVEEARKVVAKQLSDKAPSHPFPDWKAGSPTPYGALVQTFALAEATSKRLEKLSHASLFLRQVLRLTPDDLLMVIHLMINKLAADYEGVELGIGESLLMKAIGESCGRSMDKIREDQNAIGDLGMVAMKSRNNQGTLFKPKPLTVKSVHQGLLEIATIKGEGGQGRKVAGIKKLLAAAKGDEAKYLVRGLEGRLRTGLADNTVIVALSQAGIVHEMEKKGENTSVSMLTEAELKLRSVFSELPSYEVIIPAMMEHGILKLKDVCKLQPGVPLKPMLAKPTKAISEVLDRFENKRFTCEYKYDGERAQIHFVSPDSSITYPATSISATTSPTKGITKIFSRNSEDLSTKYPDIFAVLDKWVKPGVESFVLDCEAVAWDKEEKRVLPFQQLMTRKKKDVKIEDVKVKVCVFAFDLLFFNGKSLCQETLEERRRVMHESFAEIEGEFTFATYADANDLEQIQVFLDESVKASCEGLMVKMLDGEESGYEPSKRSRNWLKVKKDYLAGIGDSLDLVVLGAYYGRGKRTGGYGAFLLACYNPSTQNYESICNIGTGFSEVNLEEFYTVLSELEIDKPKPYYYHDSGNKQQPDVWFEPKIVWEVKAADLSLSPVYKAAAGMADDTGKGRGISLRFPRFIKVRDDKGPDDATTSNQVADMYKNQEVIINGNKKSSKGVDDDFEY